MRWCRDFQKSSEITEIPEPPATATVVWADPVLLPAADNGGLTATMAPDDGSPAIDGGVSAGAPQTDQRGRLRPPPVDVGAYETPQQALALTACASAWTTSSYRPSSRASQRRRGA